MNFFETEEVKKMFSYEQVPDQNMVADFGDQSYSWSDETGYERQFETDFVDDSENRENREEGNSFLDSMRENQDFFDSLSTVGIFAVGGIPTTNKVSWHGRRFHLLTELSLVIVEDKVVQRFLLPPLYHDILARAQDGFHLDNKGLPGTCYGVRPKIRGIDVVCFGVETKDATRYYIWESNRLFEVESSSPFQAYKVDDKYYVSTDIGEDFYFRCDGEHQSYEFRSWHDFTLADTCADLEVNIDFVEYTCKYKLFVNLQVDNGRMFDGQGFVVRSDYRDGYYQAEIVRYRTGIKVRDRYLDNFVSLNHFVHLSDVVRESGYMAMEQFAAILFRNTIKKPPLTVGRPMFYFKDYYRKEKIDNGVFKGKTCRTFKDMKSTVEGAIRLKNYDIRYACLSKDMQTAYDQYCDYRMTLSNSYARVKEGYIVYSDAFYYYQMMHWVMFRGWFLQGVIARNVDYVRAWKRRGSGEFPQHVIKTSFPVPEGVLYRGQYLSVSV